jgi:trehalose 6-phosphate synthase
MGRRGEMANGARDLVVVANRLPVHAVESQSSVTWDVSPGGLVSALLPALRERSGTWIGWSGSTVAAGVPHCYEGIELREVRLSEAEYEDFYIGFANGTLWPLYHDTIRTPTFDRSWWRAYEEVNLRYAQCAADAAAPGATVWVHDYQLQLVPKMLRDLRPDVRIGFFLHIPFPPQELFMQLPTRREILSGLLGADLVGFQVPLAASNFSRLARRLTGAQGTDALVRHEDRLVRVASFPISVDARDLMRRAADAGMQARARQIRSELGDPEVLLLGVDRLDYTKGIDRRLRAVGELFEEGVLEVGRHVIVQIAVPSRELDGHYRREREHIERLVGEINGKHSEVGHPAIQYLYQNVGADELVALYLAADVMVVTPFRDGMNLVSKEYVSCRVDASGVLILSEFTGAASELQGAVLVNPHDLDGLEDAITHSLDLDPDEARARMRRMRRAVRRHDVHAWAHRFLAALQ